MSPEYEHEKQHIIVYVSLACNGAVVLFVTLTWKATAHPSRLAVCAQFPYF